MKWLLGFPKRYVITAGRESADGLFRLAAVLALVFLLAVLVAGLVLLGILSLVLLVHGLILQMCFAAKP